MSRLDAKEERLLQRLHDRYIRVIDDDMLEQWPELFTQEGVYRITSRENHEQGLPLSVMLCKGRGMMRDRITGFRRINVYEPQRYSHQISGLEVLRVEGGAVDCISNFLVIRTLQGGDISVFASGVYLDRVILEEDRAWFEERVAVTDSRRIDTLLVIPL